MKFTKENWYYVTEVEGKEYVVQKRSETANHWECTTGNYVYKGKTRKEAVMMAVNEVRMTKTQQYKAIEKQLKKVMDYIVEKNYRGAEIALNHLDKMLQEIEENRLTKKYFTDFNELWDLVDSKM